MAEPITFEPDKINVGQMYVQRITFRLPIPPEGEVVAWGPFEFPNVDLPPKKLLSSNLSLYMHPEDPELVTAMVSFGLAPESYFEYQEQQAAEQRAAIFEHLGSETPE